MNVTLVKTANWGYVPFTYDLSQGHTWESLKELPLYEELSEADKEDLNSLNNQLLAGVPFLLAMCIPSSHYETPDTNPEGLSQWQEIKEEILKEFGVTLTFHEAPLSPEEEEQIVNEWEAFAHKHSQFGR